MGISLAVSRRVFLTLPDGVADDLERWAEAEGNKAASLAGFIVEKAIRDAKEQGKIPELPSYKTIGELVEKKGDRLINYGRFQSGRLQAIKNGDRPTELEIARLALALGLDESYIETLANK